MRWAGYVACMGRGEVHAGLWWGIGRPRRRWEDNIEINLQEIGWRGLGLMWLRIGAGGGLLCSR